MGDVLAENSSVIYDNISYLLNKQIWKIQSHASEANIKHAP